MPIKLHNRLSINFLSIIPRANLLFHAHKIHLPLLRKAPAGLLKKVKNKIEIFKISN